MAGAVMAAVSTAGTLERAGALQALATAIEAVMEMVARAEGRGRSAGGAVEVPMAVAAGWWA